MSEKNNQDSTSEGKMKEWLQENMRILVSIIIVIAIAGGVYSYSQRSVDDNSSDKVAQVTTEEDSTANEEAMTEESEEVSPEATNNQTQESTEEATKQEDRTSSTATSQETNESFIETAGAGDGLTHLARRALANYLEKNPDSSLTPEHKIYIEDYLRKNVGFNQGVRVGTSVEFSKALIQDSISKAKGLNEKQLQNLHKYALRVPSIS